ncbi:UDP-N-acetylglucosamine--N-acetylmuramyl-(pentapeptide) pyrophosphoryl-undecaprenol N-acetylglucosamine transferase 1 [Paenibacillus baekrokdamisoli]|uniref:UDP-N-acetylglucosamine--N-acetylmuramyl-(pentapeptide) pyrophosphoryl-undecaprenol N-acetylglucosamine transferase n=1 Tax=Paenibacillus baekrokdamisoli TaxID=1712516 RepID=A0A3G9J634_9BACL|nr:undecaprenyldiphospho-muramoylpentapeptide beta-N-acetylglucosaminyltransferase [Paenibacillus baekrokdamisoli]MBB3070216.1 UDP-N-acetylglucosamine--N-acetylmuramyl-(pentapeptide) pyrophosphoryl-undecaprenol N-acetylglucosamine transferase [Paenibacillus baekrokdamisoli]BBH21221.1 UDP-N-acetylglucosamine--N-acetylmuramyl-(pentapeptide) pyrophosphoryl-undecaprenol N-acetylglucosamine transferase 1 [Paenibacillus baekrokdamisoli]
MRIVLTGGGTGGHIYPALAVGKQVLAEIPGSSILYIGSPKGLESRIVPAQNIPFESVEITGFKRKLSLDNIKTVMRFLKGVRRSKQLLREFKPDVVVGTGGYVCGPVVYAAAKLGIPTLIHEQNAVSGLTNQFLTRYADCVAVSFKDSLPQFKRSKHAVYTGNPCATPVIHASKEKGFGSLGLPAGSRIVLMVGGSRGAKAINDAMVDMVPLLNRLPEVHFVFVTGESYYEQTKERMNQAMKSLPTSLQVLPYLHNMPEVLAASELVVGRSGASSLAELTALGIPSILIPSPNVTNNHQEANARSLVDAGAAEMITEREVTGEVLFGRISAIMNSNARLSEMKKNARKLGMPQSASLITTELITLMNKSKR